MKTYLSCFAALLFSSGLNADSNNLVGSSFDCTSGQCPYDFMYIGGRIIFLNENTYKISSIIARSLDQSGKYSFDGKTLSIEMLKDNEKIPMSFQATYYPEKSKLILNKLGSVCVCTETQTFSRVPVTFEEKYEKYN